MSLLVNKLSARTLRQCVRLVLVSTAIGLIVAPAAHACSLVSPWEIRRASRLEFMGTPLPDTVLAGAGSRTFSEQAGHFGPGTARTIYGQRVSVDRLGARARRALPAGVREVVLVPWDYGADCRPVPWSRSARWLPDTRSGLFAAQLRPREHWAGNVPTFDITPFMQPYYDPSPDSTVRDWLPRPRVRAERLLRMFDELWSLGATLDSGQVRRWTARASADTSLADKWPVTMFRH